MQDIITGISVLLIFLTFLLTSLDKQVFEKINKAKPPKSSQKNANRKFNNELLTLLLLIALPILLIFFVSFWSLLPRTLAIINSNSFSLWNFDELKTIFIFIEIGLLGMTIFAFVKIVELFKKINSKT